MTLDWDPGKVGSMRRWEGMLGATQLNLGRGQEEKDDGRK